MTMQKGPKAVRGLTLFSWLLAASVGLIVLDVIDRNFLRFLGIHTSPAGWADGQAIGISLIVALLVVATFEWRALRRSIASNEGRLAVHDQSELDAHSRFMNERAKIRGVLATSGRIQIVLQPIVSVDSGAVVGHEALSRFEGSGDPAEWFALAARVGLGAELELCAIELALAAMPPTGYLFINASPVVMASQELLEAVVAHPEPERIVVELTEHAAVADYASLLVALKHLRAMGVRLAIDDTGSGISSLTHVVSLEPEMIKLDRSLVQGIDTDHIRRSLAETLNNFADSISSRIIAEGVETLGELATIRAIHIPFAQGFVFGAPRSSPTSDSEVMDTLNARRATVGSGAELVRSASRVRHFANLFPTSSIRLEESEPPSSTTRAITRAWVRSSIG